MERIEKRIAETLENELCNIYDEMGIDAGDITPLQLFEFEGLVIKTAKLFAELIDQNK